MGREILIRCGTDLPLSETTKKIERLLNVKCETHSTSYGESFLFSCMGLDGAIYYDPIESDVADLRLKGFGTVVNLGFYADPLGKAYEEFDALLYIALFVAGIIARALNWACFICTEEDNVLDEVSLHRGNGTDKIGS